jgi:hypothetical protein
MTGKQSWWYVPSDDGTAVLFENYNSRFRFIKKRSQFRQRIAAAAVVAKVNTEVPHLPGNIQ